MLVCDSVSVKGGAESTCVSRTRQSRITLGLKFVQELSSLEQ